MAVWVGAAALLTASNSLMTFCWFCCPVPRPDIPTWNERFCQRMLLYRIGFENAVQLG